MCYTVPLITSVFTTCAWSKKRDSRLWQLNLMLYGASLFGVIDHLWNGELFLVSDNIAKDLLLGVVITIAVFIGWEIGLAINKHAPTKIA